MARLLRPTPLCQCAGAILAAVASFGCAEPSPPLFEVQAHVTSDGSAPVAGAQVRVRGNPLGTTDPLGRVTFRVSGQEGDRLPVALTCPDGFSEPVGGSSLALTSGPGSNAARTLALELMCELELRDAVVLVHAAGGASRLPVKVDGAVVGQTDALGFAHVHVRAAPDSEFEVSLDTSANGRLLPVNPARRFRLLHSDELFVLDTTFEVPKASARKRRAPNELPRRQEREDRKPIKSE
jgi:hypothetical protein